MWKRKLSLNNDFCKLTVSSVHVCKCAISANNPLEKLQEIRIFNILSRRKNCRTCVLCKAKNTFSENRGQFRNSYESLPPTITFMRRIWFHLKETDPAIFTTIYLLQFPAIGCCCFSTILIKIMLLQTQKPSLENLCPALCWRRLWDQRGLNFGILLRQTMYSCVPRPLIPVTPSKMTTTPWKALLKS